MPWVAWLSLASSFTGTASGLILKSKELLSAQEVTVVICVAILAFIAGALLVLFSVLRIKITVKIGFSLNVLLVATLVYGIRSPSPLPPPLATYDFETDLQGWGEHPEGEIHDAGLRVKRYRGDAPRAKNGEWVLEFNTTDPGNHDTYVTVLEGPGDHEVTAWVYVPPGADIYSKDEHGNAVASTVKIIVWAKDGHSEESAFIKLTHGVWQRIAWRPGKGDWEEFGLHFFWVGSYRRPVYVDRVNLSK